MSPSPTPSTTPEPPFTLTSDAFRAGGKIPRTFSCDGADVSPALAWSGAPEGTAALALIVDDPDASGFVHWVVVDLPGAASGTLHEDISPSAGTPQQGRNGFGRNGWGGPCPPSGTHHYVFTLYALSEPLGLDGHPRAADVRSAMKGQTLAKATLTGTYRRGG